MIDPMQRLSDGVLGHLDDVLVEPGVLGQALAELSDEATLGVDGPLVRVADRFEIVGTLGRGGMGEVYQARDMELGRNVALKVQHVGDPWLDHRFEREVTALAEIEHPCLVSHIGHGRSVEGVLWLATELLTGETLAERLRNGTLSTASALQITRDIVSALGALHRRGFVHRDVKPSNIFVTSTGSAKLLDLGLLGADKSGLTPSGASLTEGGALLGSIGYLSPEQARGQRRIDATADFFALGCVLFECLTGAPPFGRSLAETAAAFAMSADPPLAKLPLASSRGVRTLIDELLQIDPGKRPQTAESLERRLSQLWDQARELAEGPLDEETRPRDVRILRVARLDLPWYDASSVAAMRSAGMLSDTTDGDSEPSQIASALACGEVANHEALLDAYAQRGTSSPALVLVGGALALTHDPQQRQHATRAAAALGHTKEAIEHMVERALIESRAFARRKLFAGFPIRALFTLDPGTEAFPIYLSEAAAAELPLMRTFQVRAIVELCAANDGIDVGPLALRVLALARVVERCR